MDIAAHPRLISHGRLPASVAYAARLWRRHRGNAHHFHRCLSALLRCLLQSSRNLHARQHGVQYRVTPASASIKISGGRVAVGGRVGDAAAPCLHHQAGKRKSL